MDLLGEIAVDGWQVRAAPAASFTLEDNEFYGRAVPYGEPVELWPGLREQFLTGAFAAAVKDPARVKVAYRHGEVVGHAAELVEKPDGLWIRGRIVVDDDLPDGRMALAQLRNRLADELSVGFQQVPKGTVVEDDEKGGTLVTHKRARLREVSIVPWGAFGRHAVVKKVRDRSDAQWRERMRARFDALG